jgi:hypothetical protein
MRKHATSHSPVAKVQPEIIMTKPIKTLDAETQTEVDDFGVWDKQRGWCLPITGTALSRNAWRRAIQYASCPSCRGVGRSLLS